MNNRKLYENIMNGISKSLKEDFEITTDGYRRFGKSFEDEPKELERLQKKIINKKNGKKEVYYRFGKNGMGLTREFMAIGADIYELSKKYHVYLDNQSYFDECDDVYDIMVHCLPRKMDEGAWGFKPDESDTYWDHTHIVTDDVYKQLIQGLKPGKKFKKQRYNEMRYTYMGLINGFLKADRIWREVLYSRGLELYREYEKTFNELNDDDDNVEGWSDFKKYKTALRKTFEDFKNIMKDKYDFDLKKAIKEEEEEKKKKKSPEKANNTIGKVMNENFEPFHMPVYDEVSWQIPEQSAHCYDGTTRDLPDGRYTAKYYACTFELMDGKRYYSPIGVRRSRAPWEEYYVCNGELWGVENYNKKHHKEDDPFTGNFLDDFEPFDIDSDKTWKIPVEL